MSSGIGKRNKGKKDGDKGEKDGPVNGNDTKAVDNVDDVLHVNGNIEGFDQNGPASPVTPGIDGALDPISKKIRNLNKKVCFIPRLLHT